MRLVPIRHAPPRRAPFRSRLGIASALLALVAGGCATEIEVERDRRAVSSDSPSASAPYPTSDGGEIFRHPAGVATRWASFENPSGSPGAGGTANRGAKGRAFDLLPAGGRVVLLDAKGPGTVRRVWLTMNGHNHPRVLREVRIEATWDGAATPAVSAPIGDFFGAILGRLVPFENEFFASPEGKSFNCFVPMPFRESARIELVNDGAEDVKRVFYDVAFTTGDRHGDDALYFHAHWRREPRTELGRDFEILPKVSGRGRYLGAHIGAILDDANKGWWGEGEFKAFLDGDGALPTLVGTGTEDYIGTGWGQGTFSHRYQGSLVVDDALRHQGFYRYHVPDPVWFARDFRATIQQIGGADKKTVQWMLDQGTEIRPISVDSGGADAFVRLLETDPPTPLESAPEGWTNYLRRDDFSAVAFFYLDSPENGLPPIAGVAERTAGIPDKLP